MALGLFCLTLRKGTLCVFAGVEPTLRNLEAAGQDFDNVGITLKASTGIG